MNDLIDEKAQRGIVRHALLDRLFHWMMAVSVLVLLFTAFLPIAGVKFSWVTAHWVSGIILTLIIAVHSIRSLFWQDLASMGFWLRDIKELLANMAWLLKPNENGLIKPGKYSPAQKLMHHGVGVFVLITIVTGLLMMVKIDTPFWARNPYWLSDQRWGIVYLFHGSAALFLVVITMIHIYFAFRPEKLMYTRSMISGLLSRTEYENEHDPRRWRK